MPHNSPVSRMRGPPESPGRLPLYVEVYDQKFVKSELSPLGLSSRSQPVDNATLRNPPDEESEKIGPPSVRPNPTILPVNGVSQPRVPRIPGGRSRLKPII